MCNTEHGNGNRARLQACHCTAPMDTYTYLDLPPTQKPTTAVWIGTEVVFSVWGALAIVSEGLTSPTGSWKDFLHRFGVWLWSNVVQIFAKRLWAFCFRTLFNDGSPIVRGWGEPPLSYTLNMISYITPFKQSEQDYSLTNPYRNSQLVKKNFCESCFDHAARMSGRCGYGILLRACRSFSHRRQRIDVLALLYIKRQARRGKPSQGAWKGHGQGSHPAPNYHVCGIHASQRLTSNRLVLWAVEGQEAHIRTCSLESALLCQLKMLQEVTMKMTVARATS